MSISTHLSFPKSSTQRSMMLTLESFPNEVLLSLFDYIPTGDLLKTFAFLNSRLAALVLYSIRSNGFDFGSISRVDFDTICQQYLPDMASHIGFLGLSDCDRSPGQLDRFYQSGFHLPQFTQLKSLSLERVWSETLLSRVLSELPQLAHLTSLSLKNCLLPTESSAAQAAIDAIWKLSKLTFCRIVNGSTVSNRFVVPTVTSSSIRTLSLRMDSDSSIELVSLFEHTPNLRHLSMNLPYYWRFRLISSPITLLRTLHLSLFHVQVTPLMDFLKQLPGLRRLRISMQYGFIYGEQWEQLITNHLPQLTTFQFRMKSAFDKENNREERIDEILNTFRSPFWLEQHRWYVRCDWTPGFGKMYLYTIPYAFDDFSCEYSIVSKGTYPRKLNRHWYDSVQTLTYRPRLSTWSSHSPIKFYRIEELTIEFPINEVFYSMVPVLSHVRSLNVSCNDLYVSPNMQLQALLDRLPNLRSLSYHRWPSSDITQMPPFDTTCASVRQLDLRFMDRRYDRDQCIALGRSPLGRQCEILALAIKDKDCMPDLVNTMDHLRTLSVDCTDWPIQRVWSSSKDELAEQLS